MTEAIESIPIKTITGEAATLGDHAGKVRLVVNVASKCGLTPQYEALEELHDRLNDRGFTVMGFPANDFGAQEPGDEEEIAEFCRSNFGVTFPMFSKIVVTGPEKHPLYAELTAQRTTKSGDAGAFRERLKGFGMTPTEDPEVLWNFEKFVVGRNGRVVGRFAPTVAPDDPELIRVIEREIEK